ncbi:mammalian cell entry protein [Mycolicibacillus koreensis]|nr:mammalian cell entry protein [Mycolicibacillus koreensis]
MLLTPFIKRQLVLFAVITLAAFLALGWYYLRIPSLMGIGQYTLTAELPSSGGLYATSNVTYQGITVGKVTSVEPTEEGAVATLRLDSKYKIPADASAHVHSVSAVGEQYLDLVSAGTTDKLLAENAVITDTTVPAPIGPILDEANRMLAALPKEKVGELLDETAVAVGGLGPALQRLVDSTQAIAGDFQTNIADINDIVDNVGPILDSQVDSGDAIERWATNLNVLATQSAQKDAALRRLLPQAATSADQLNEVMGGMRDTLPQTLANTAIVLDILKRYRPYVEAMLVAFPQEAASAQAVTAPYENEARALLDLGLTINQPPPCMTGFLPASEWRPPADTSSEPAPSGLYCKIPKDTPANVVRGARNIPCADVPEKRAATPKECRSDEPYEPLGTNPWYGDPEQYRNCPAPGARCDQPVDPGRVIPAPSVNNGMNPAPADKLPPPASPGGKSSVINDPVTRPGSGTVQCNGQQPNPCVYTPSAAPAAAVYTPSSGELVGPDGVRYHIDNSTDTGDDGWKEMLAPVS